jgi:hypothetical protein
MCQSGSRPKLREVASKRNFGVGNRSPSYAVYCRREFWRDRMIKDLWCKNAVIYCLSVTTYMDTDGDGCPIQRRSPGAAGSAPLDLPQGIHIGLRLIEEVSREYRRP